MVGSKNFTEQVILGEIVAAQLEARGFAVDRRLNLGRHAAVPRGACARGQTRPLRRVHRHRAHRHPQAPGPDAIRRACSRTVREGYAALGLRVGAPLGFNNTFALVMRRDDARGAGACAASPTSRRTRPRLRVGLFGEFLEREDGMPGLVARLRPALRRAAAGDGPRPALSRRWPRGQVDLVVGSATDGLIAALDLVVLEDDRHYFPPYDAVPVMRHLAAPHPGLAGVVAVAGRIDEKAMRR